MENKYITAANDKTCTQQKHTSRNLHIRAQLHIRVLPGNPQFNKMIWGQVKQNCVILLIYHLSPVKIRCLNIQSSGFDYNE